MNPTLINNKKFDFRTYVLITGMNPLKIYFYKDGYLKIPVKNFTLDYIYINDKCVHITTSDINLICYKGKEYKYDTNIYMMKILIFGVIFFLKNIVIEKGLIMKILWSKLKILLLKLLFL